MKIIRFIKSWALPISMLSGVLAYFVYVNIPILDDTHEFVLTSIGILQPTLIFCMLFLTFCRVSPHELHPHRWHVWLMLVQVLSFMLFAVVSMLIPNCDARVLLESGMICMICPTATAAAVITARLNGSAASIVTYTIIANLTTAVIAPIFLPLVHPMEGMNFSVSFFLIIGKVFPLLICPLLAAWLIRYLLPSLHRQLIKYKNLSFYLWTIALALAIGVTTKAIVHCQFNIWYEVGIAVVSLVCCLAQFYIGKRIGSRYGDRVACGQALGQKSTVFAIWMGYTFLTPITAIAGGFYSVWHNVINSYQLYQARKKE